MSLKAYGTLYSFLCLSLRDTTPGNKDAATFPKYRRENMHKEFVSVAFKSRFECGQHEGQSSHAPVHTTSMNHTSERPNSCGTEIVWIKLPSSGRTSDIQTSHFQYCTIGKYKVLWTAVGGYHTCKKMPQVQQLFLANGFPFPAVAMLCLQLAIRQHKRVTQWFFVCVTRMKSVTAELWQVLAHFKRLRTSRHIIRTGSVQALLPQKHVQKFWSSTTDNKVVHPIQHPYNCRMCTAALYTLFAPHPKDRACKSYHSIQTAFSPSVLWTEELETANQQACTSPPKRRQWHTTPPWCCKWTTLEQKALVRNVAYKTYKNSRSVQVMRGR